MNHEDFALARPLGSGIPAKSIRSSRCSSQNAPAGIRTGVRRAHSLRSLRATDRVRIRPRSSTPTRGSLCSPLGQWRRQKCSGGDSNHGRSAFAPLPDSESPRRAFAHHVVPRRMLRRGFEPESDVLTHFVRCARLTGFESARVRRLRLAVRSAHRSDNGVDRNAPAGIRTTRTSLSLALWAQESPRRAFARHVVPRRMLRRGFEPRSSP